MIRLFVKHDCKLGSRLKIDIDVEFDDFMNYYINSWIEHLRFIDKLINLRVCSIDVLRSTNNHVHIFVFVERKLSEYERIHLQYALGDDIGRFNLSLSRLLEWGRPYDKIFWKKLRNRKK